jgi:hypothetical protein
MKNWIFYSICFIVTISCESVVSVDVPPIQSALAVNSSIFPDSLIRVKVYKTLATLDRKDFSEIENAEVILYKNDLEVEKLTFYSDIRAYQSVNQRATIGDRYRIKVNSPGYQEASSETIIPAPVTLNSAIRKDSAGVNEEGYFYQTFSFTFNDPAGVENYYAVEVSETNMHIYQNVSGSKDTAYHSNAVILKADPTSYEGPEMILFNDKLFDGKEHTKRFETGTHYFRYGGGQEQRKYNVVFKTVTKEYYEYYKRLRGHLDNQGTSIFAGEPVVMPSNISGGYGIFCGASEYRMEVTKQ